MAAAKKKRAGVEWVGGLVTLPTYVTGEGEVYRPEGLMWMLSDGPVLGMTMAKAGDLLGRAAAHLQSTIERPMTARAPAPTRVRVASPELAEVLRAAEPGMEIVCAPMPELDAVVARLRERMHEEVKAEQSYLSAGTDPRPWVRLPVRTRTRGCWQRTKASAQDR